MIPALLLISSAVAYRVTTGLLIHSGASWLSNFAPLAAIALCSAAYLPKKYKFSVPLVTLFISDAVINFRYGAPLLDPQILLRYFARGLIQALTIGLPQYSATPSWMFFRNSLISDLLFTLLFVISMNFGRSAESSRARAARFRPAAAG